MQARIVNGGDDVFNNLLYGKATPGRYEIIQNSIANARERLGCVGQEFLNKVQSTYETIRHNATMTTAKMLTSHYDSGIHGDNIYVVNKANLPDISYKMQQYIMANPTLNRLANDNMCYGFTDTYYDPEQGIIGEERDDYNRVVTGTVRFDTKSKGYYNTYSSSSEEEPLHPVERANILESWDNALELLSNGIDPTDPDLNEL